MALKTSLFLSVLALGCASAPLVRDYPAMGPLRVMALNPSELPGVCGDASAPNRVRVGCYRDGVAYISKERPDALLDELCHHAYGDTKHEGPCAATWETLR